MRQQSMFEQFKEYLITDVSFLNLFSGVICFFVFMRSDNIPAFIFATALHLKIFLDGFDVFMLNKIKATTDYLLKSQNEIIEQYRAMVGDVTNNKKGANSYDAKTNIQGN